MFRPFPNWPSSGWIQCQRNYIPTINIVISVSVSTEKGEKGGGARSRDIINVVRSSGKVLVILVRF